MSFHDTDSVTVSDMDWLFSGGVDKSAKDRAKMARHAKWWLGAGIVLSLGVLTGLGFFLAWQFGYYKPYTGPKPPADDPRVTDWMARKRGQIDPTDKNCFGKKGSMDKRCKALPPKFNVGSDFGDIFSNCMFKTDGGMSHNAHPGATQPSSKLAECQPKWDADVGQFIPPSKTAIGQCFTQSPEDAKEFCNQQCGWNAMSGAVLSSLVGVSSQVLCKSDDGAACSSDSNASQVAIDPVAAKACAAGCTDGNVGQQMKVPQNTQPPNMSKLFYNCWNDCNSNIKSTGVLRNIPSTMFCESMCSMRNDNGAPGWFNVQDMTNALQSCQNSDAGNGPITFPTEAGTAGWTDSDLKKWTAASKCVSLGTNPAAKICPAMVTATEVVSTPAVANSGSILPYGQHLQPIGGYAKRYGAWSTTPPSSTPS